MMKALEILDQGGDFIKMSRLDERKDLQASLRKCLHAIGIKVVEGLEVAGGETDLVLNEIVVLENKVLGETGHPFDELGPAGWQARRYSIAISQRVRFICAAYKPDSEVSLRPLTDRIRVRRAAGSGDAVEVLFLVPYGQGVPSTAGRT
jgi:hypothetical protein